MRYELARRVRRVGVTDPLAATQRYDYADAYEFRLPTPDRCPPVAWVRAGLGNTPPAVRRITGLLGMRAAPASASAADRVGPFRIVASTADMVHLETNLPLLRVALIGRKVEPTRRMLTTTLRYERPVLARLVWALVGIGHRRTVPRIITGDPAAD